MDFYESISAYYDHLFPVDAQAVRVVATFSCGGVTCWERWLQIDSKRIGVSRVCESPAGDRLQEVPR